MPVGRLFAGYAAFREKDFALARKHLDDNDESGHQSLLGSTLLCVCNFENQTWDKTLQHLDSVETQLASASPQHRSWTNRFLGNAEKRQLVKAYCLAQTDQNKIAEELLRGLDGTDQKLPARLIRASLLERTNRRNEAIALLKSASQTDPKNVSVVVALAKLHAANGDRQVAASALQTFVDSNPDDVAPRLVLARLLSRDAAQRHQALQLLADVRRRAPEVPEGWTLAAGILLRGKDAFSLDDLLRQMKRQKEVSYLTPLITACSALQRAGLNDAALALAEANSELRQTDQWMLLSANVALEQGKADQSLELFSQAMQSQKANVQASQGFLRALATVVQSGPSETTREKVTVIRKKWPTEPAAIPASLVLAAQAEDFAKATAELEQLRKHDTDKGRPAFWHATILSSQGKMREALTALEPALGNTHGTLPARMLAAKIELFRDRPAEALRYLVPTQTGESFEATLLRAEILRRLRRADEAAVGMEQLVEQASKFDRGWLMLSRVYEDVSSSDAPARAQQALKRGLVHLPGNDGLENRLITLQLRHNDLEQAKTLANEIFRESPQTETALRIAGLFLDHSHTEQADIWLAKSRETTTEQTLPVLSFLEATSLQKLGEKTKNETTLRQAEAAYKKLLTENSTNIGALNNLAWMKLKDFDDPAAAANLVSRIRSLIPDRSLPPGILDTVVETLRATGKSEEAIQLVEKSLLKHPDEALLRFHYGVLLHELAGQNRFQRSRAIRELERAEMLGSLSADRRRELSQALRQWKLAAN